MEIKIDLADIFGGEEPYLTVEEAVKHEVIRTLTATIKAGVEKQINAEVSKVINETIAEALKDKMPTLINDLLNAEYMKVDRWGDRDKGATTFRKELVKAVTEQMTYKKDNPNALNPNLHRRRVCRSPGRCLHYQFLQKDKGD